MMPEIDGQQALRESRLMEKAKGIAGPNHVKIIMTTALLATGPTSKEAFPGPPRKIIAAIPAVIHLSHFSGQERQAGRHCIVNNGSVSLLQLDDRQSARLYAAQ